jgi:hypothetical protein
MEYSDIRQLILAAERSVTLTGELVPWPEADDASEHGEGQPAGRRPDGREWATAADRNTSNLAAQMPGPRRKRRRLALIEQQLQKNPATVEELAQHLEDLGEPIPESTLYGYVEELERHGRLVCDNGLPRTWSVART